MNRSRKKRQKSLDPFETAIESALEPGQFIGYNQAFSFVSKLKEVEQEIEALVKDEPVRAADLYETFLAGCYEKIEELDDSGDNLGMFVSDLFRGWVKAREKSGADPKETTARLLAWMDDDPYGFAHDLVTDVIKAFSKKGRTAFAAAVRARFEAAADDVKSYERRRWGEALKTIYASSRNLKSYINACEETELLPTDCEVIANILKTRRKPEEALEWVEKGLEIEHDLPPGRRSWHHLESLKRELLKKVGRGDEALDSAWQKFVEYPSEFSYDELMKYVSKTQKKDWHQRAVRIIKKADLDQSLKLLIKIKEMDLLIDRLRAATDQELEELSHYVTEPIAEKLKTKHPETAARLYSAMGMRILNAGKSKYYVEALSNFENAKRCWGKADLATLWRAVVDEIRINHKRKYSFIPQFEEIVAGKSPSATPSFLERAKNRWKR